MNNRIWILPLLTLLLTGCAEIGVLANKTVGPPPVPAKHTLAPVSTLILVENYRNYSAAQFDAENLSRAVNEEFRNHELGPLVEIDRMYLLRDNDPKAFRSMTIPAIGRACGAHQVVYIDLLDLGANIEQLSHYARGGGTVRVRVVDCKTGKTIWPEDISEGFLVTYRIRLNGTNEPIDSLRARVCKGTADRITRLFYSYKPDEVPE